MSAGGGLLRAVLAGALAFLVIGLLVSAVVGGLFQPDLRGLTSDQEIESYARIRVFTFVVAGFLGALGAGALGRLLADRWGLAGRTRRAAILAAPLAVGILWLLASEPTSAMLATSLKPAPVGPAVLRPTATIFVAGTLLYLLGAVIGAAAAGLVAERSRRPT